VQISELGGQVPPLPSLATRLFNGRVICRKPKTQSSRKTSSQFQYIYCKEGKLYIANIKFLLDFLVPENLDRASIDVRIILPSVHFQGLTMVWFYELHYRETKFV